jgi:HlyD family secretion protein
MKRAVILTTALAVIVVAVFAYATSRQGVPVQAAKVQRGEVREFIDERGKTRLPKTYLITMPFAGRVEPIAFLEGQTVQRDQVVARIAAKDLDYDVAEAQAAVERLHAAIAENDDVAVESSSREQAELFVKSMVSTVAAAVAQLSSEESRVAYAEKYLGRIQSLPRGVETQDELDRANLSFIESQIDYRQAALTVESLKAIQSATGLLPRMVGEYIAHKSLTRAVLEKEVQEADARLREALLRQQRGEMRSPIDGMVLERAVSNERYLDAGTTLLQLGQLEDLEVEAEVLSEDVVRVQVGDSVEIYGPAIGAPAGGGVAGVVHRIHPAGFTKISSLGVEQQRVLVIIRFADGVLPELGAQREIGVDYRVRVRIFTDERSDALWIPRSAIFRAADGGWQVFTIRGGRAERLPISVGLMNDTQVEVTNGLSAGDVVVLAPETALTSGTRVLGVSRDP